MKKKLLAALLVAILASSMVFAGITGSVTTSAGYNLDTKEYGFLGVDKASSEFELKLASEKGASKVAEDANIYASVKSSLDITATVGKNSLGKTDGAVAFDFDFLLDEAQVGGKLGNYNWFVSILGTPDAPSFASAFTDANRDGYLDDDYKIGYFGANGVTVGFADYEFGLGFHGQKDNGNSITVSAKTPAYELLEGLTLQAAAAYSHRGALDAKDGMAASGAYWYFDNETETFKIAYLYGAVDAIGADNHNFGGSVKVAYKNDIIGASVASDMGVKSIKKDPKFGMDLAASFAYDFISVDTYYAFKDTLHAQVSTDFGKLVESVPVTLTVGVNNIIKDNRSLAASVGFKGYGVEASVSGEVGLYANPSWSVAVDAAYSIADYAKVLASFSYNSSEWLGASVAIETESLIPNAKLALGWYDAADLLNKNNGRKLAKYTPVKYDKDGEPNNMPGLSALIPNHTDKGVVKASCTISF